MGLVKRGLILLICISLCIPSAYGGGAHRLADRLQTIEQGQDMVGGMYTNNTETRITVTYNDVDGTVDFVADEQPSLTAEEVADLAGAMVTGNTETDITVTYQDADNTIDFVVDDSFLRNAGDTYTGTHDMSGVTAIEIENTAGDVTLANGGEIAVDTTQRQYAYHDGTVEIAIPSIRTIQGRIVAGDWDIDSDVKIVDLDASRYPDGIVITAWQVDANSADPAVELNANLMHGDYSTGVFPDAGSATLVDVLDTTTGNSSEADMSNSDLGSGVIPTDQTLYIDIDIDPATATDFFWVLIEFYIPES